MTEQTPSTNPLAPAEVEQEPQAQANAESTLPTQVLPQEDSPATEKVSNVSPETFGRIDESGTVWVKDGEEERSIGQYPDVVPADPLDMYIRRFLDLEAQVTLFAARLPNLSARDIDTTLATLSEAVVAPAAIGDLVALRERVAQLQTQAQARKEEARAERARAKEEALAARNLIVEEAEQIAAKDPEQTQWKQSGARLRVLLDQWKTSQRQGPRLDRATEDQLWKRFSSARTTFDRHRRQFFSRLDAAQSDARNRKEQLIAQAQALSTSTDWGQTSSAYRSLMDQWKTVGRASRKDDDALWERFRAAQQVFFDARRAANDAVEAEFSENLKVKEELLVQAEALLPVKNIDAVKAALRPIQDAWEAAGHVPRAYVSRIERRMRAVEQAIRDAEDAEWRRTDPETKARAAGMAGQLRAQIAKLNEKLEKAQSREDTKRIKELEDALKARKAWLDQIAPAADA